ncbi:MAG: discoidin domain-containing protein [Sedimentisphaerales bacterium]|nr:discoidin domain-containing protein [Sedimentisphaerales bacterium]
MEFMLKARRQCQICPLLLKTIFSIRHPGALFVDPLFVNPAVGNFALQPTSPAMDAGTNLGSPYNLGLSTASIWPNNVSTLDQNNYGTGWEIGAYVFTSVACLPIDQTGWELEYVDSEELVEDGGCPAEYSFDGLTNTFWSTDWDINDIPPHEIQINLGGFYDVCGFRYLPRQDDGQGDENGMIKDYKFYVSGDFDMSGTIDMLDFTYFAENWLRQTW